MNEYEVNNEISEMNGNTENISDWYHTFWELYEHRSALFCALLNTTDNITFKSRLHYDGTMFGGMFIAWIMLPNWKIITYHLDNKYWDNIRISEIKNAPEWDWHTPNDVIKMLLEKF